MKVSLHRGRGAVASLATLVLIATPTTAQAAQETKWDDVASRALTCGADAHTCGRVSAVINVTAVKGSRAGWDDQSEIELLPFTTGGRYFGTAEWPPTTVICTDLKITMKAANQIVASAPFGSIPDEFPDPQVSVVGSVASLRGSKCRNLPAVTGRSHSGSVAVKPSVSTLDTFGPDIDKVSIKARTRIFISAMAYYSSGWASDTIEFD